MQPVAHSEHWKHGIMHRFSLLRPINGDLSAQDRIRETVLHAFAEYQETATEAAS
jgi:hypothetical protein